MVNLEGYRRAHPELSYKLVLTVYDSVMLDVPVKHVQRVTDEVIPLCMRENARAPLLNFSVDVDTDVGARWDEKMYLEDMVAMGLPAEFAKAYCLVDDNKQPIKKPVSS